MNIDNDIKIISHKIIFSSLFSYNSKSVNIIYPNSEYICAKDNKPNLIPYLKKNFYSNYIFQVLEKEVEAKNKNFNRVINLKDTAKFKNIKYQLKESEFNINIENVELYFFDEYLDNNKKEKLGIYTLEITINKENLFSSDITEFIINFRMLDNEEKNINYDNKNISLLNFIEDNIIKQKINEKYVSKISGSKLKSFLIINYDKTPKNLDHLLFNIGILNYSTLKGIENTWTFSDEYFSDIMNNNSIFCYSNWKALALFDTFTIIGSQVYVETWTDNYFKIYIYCLKQKFYLFHINKEIVEITKVKKDSEKLRNNFIEFISNHDVEHISYNFLPNSIFIKIKYALMIESENQLLEKKINNMNLFFSENKQKQIDAILGLISIISLSSAIWDTSEFFRSLKQEDDIKNFYPSYGFFVSIVILGLVITYFTIIKFRKK